MLLLFTGNVVDVWVISCEAVNLVDDLSVIDVVVAVVDDARQVRLFNDVCQFYNSNGVRDRQLLLFLGFVDLHCTRAPMMLRWATTVGDIAVIVDVKNDASLTMVTLSHSKTPCFFYRATRDAGTKFCLVGKQRGSGAKPQWGPGVKLWYGVFAAYKVFNS